MGRVHFKGSLQCILTGGFISSVITLEMRLLSLKPEKVWEYLLKGSNLIRDQKKWTRYQPWVPTKT
ncbi:unnamed protein product [Arabidopsis lyrata]|nr:unnamed protein product [Arabidopsis lyrata]